MTMAESPATSLPVLVVDDKAAVSNAIKVLLEVNDIPVHVAQSPEQAIELVDREEFGVVVQDMNFRPGVTDGTEGLALFRRIRALDAQLPVLVITAWTSLETAVQMVKEGATDYLPKPWDDTKLVASIRNLLRLRQLQLENEQLKALDTRAREQLSSQYDLKGAVYHSSEMHRVVSLAAQVAAADVPVLITGPNGVGKELVADIIQANSRRRNAPFVKVNAGAIPDDLLEAELFGAEPGAFTGSVKRRVGRFEAASEGTLFLDEIGNLSAAGQVKVLRVLQHGQFERLGSSETRRVDVRIIAATNVDLAAAIADGYFREDLYFRLNVIEIRVPPLRERRSDILPLAQGFLLRQPGTWRFSTDAMRALERHAWPGNVREVLNRVQRAVLMATGGCITPRDLDLESVSESGRVFDRLATPADDSAGIAGERRKLQQLLMEHGGMVSKVAARLGVSRQSLYRRMQKLGIVLERRPKLT